MKKKISADESAAAKLLAKKSNESSKPKTKTDAKPKVKIDPKRLTQSPLTDPQIIDFAWQWVRLHANPKTRDEMDELVKDLSPADSRRVILCGQRLSAGLSPRIAK